LRKHIHTQYNAGIGAGCADGVVFVIVPAGGGVSVGCAVVIDGVARGG